MIPEALPSTKNSEKWERINKKFGVQRLREAIATGLTGLRTSVDKLTGHPKTVEQKKSSEKFPELVQAGVIDTLKRGKEISLYDFSYEIFAGAGDKFMNIWAYKKCLEILCQQNNIPVDQIHLSYRTQPLTSETVDTAPYPLGEMQKYYAEQREAHLLTTPDTPVPETLLRLAAEILHVTLPTNIFDQIPTPFSYVEGTNRAIEFDLPNSQAAAAEIKKRFAGKKIVVINQAGSAAEKRFADDQVAEIGQKIKTRFPDTVVVVLSDRRIGKRNTAPEIEHELVGAPKSGIDLQVNVDNVQELSNYAMAANLIVTTDTFWSWWAGGTKVLDGQHDQGRLKPNEMIVLHTLADKRWQVGGSQAVFSRALSELPLLPDMKGMIKINEYRRFFTKDKEGTLPTGISSEDIQLLTNQIALLEL